MTATNTATATVTHLMTLQFHWGGLFDTRSADNMAHLVRGTQSGTPGPTLCGIERFTKDGPGWSVGGGVSGPGIENTPCPGCVRVARARYPNLCVHGLASKAVQAAISAVDYRHARDIPDKTFLEAIVNASHRWTPPGCASRWDVACALGGIPVGTYTEEVPGVPAKVVLAKFRRVEGRGLATGCSCGCRGDFELTATGRALLEAT